MGYRISLVSKKIMFKFNKLRIPLIFGKINASRSEEVVGNWCKNEGDTYMKQKMMGLVVAALLMTWVVTGWAQTNLTVVRHSDNTIWAMTCDGTAVCSEWTRIAGGLSEAPTLTWDSALNKYILIGIGNSGSNIMSNH